LDVGTKLLPVTISVVAVPEGIELGKTCVTVGLGLFTVNATNPPDIPPPGGGFVTVILLIAPAARFPAGITAVSCVPETKVVFNVWPFRFAIEDEINALPEIVTVVSGAPAATEFGVTLVTVGTGFGSGMGPSPLPFPPPPQPSKDTQTKIMKSTQKQCILRIGLISSFLKVVSL